MSRVSYTQISTRYDEVVVPYTSAFLAAGPRTTNVTIQDRLGPRRPHPAGSRRPGVPGAP